MDKQKKIILITAVIAFTIVLFLPLLLNEVIFDNNYITKVSNDGWAGFFGSYIGGAIGGVGTLIAVYITVRQNQKQIQNVENKEKKKKRIEEANEIATLVAAYLSDLQIYIAKKKECNDRIEKESDYSQYKNLLEYFKIERKDRFFIEFKTYMETLEKHQISREYPIRFLNSYEGKIYSNSEKMFDEYEKGLEEIISSIQERVNTINQAKNEAMQRYVLGNNSYMLLDIKLSNMENTHDLKGALGNIQNIITGNNTDIWLPFLKKSVDEEINNAINKVKQEIRIFVKEYVDKQNDKS